MEESDEGVVVLTGEAAFFGGDVAGAARYWSEHFGVVQEEASGLEAGAFGFFCGTGAFEGGAVGVYDGLGGIGVGLGLVCLLAGGDAFFEEFDGAGGDGIEVLLIGEVAGDVGFGLLGTGYIAGDVGFDFGDLTVDGLGVEFKEELALTDVLAFGEVDFQDGSGDAGFDFDSGAGFDGADGGDFERDVGGGGLDGADSLGGVGVGCSWGGLAVAGEGGGED